MTVKLLPCGCDSDDFWHDLFGECMKDYVAPRRPCCGRAGDDRLVQTVCEHGCCIAFYCPCGVHDYSGIGPAGCRCGHAEFGGRWPVAQRPMLSTPNGHEYTRRQRARAKGRR